VPSPTEAIDRFFRTGLRLSHLRTLAALVRFGQVRKVAEAFCVTQSAISKQIAEIETGLGETVVQRQGNNLVLTAVGQHLAGRAQDILRQIDRTRDEITSLSSGVGGHLSIGAVTTTNTALVPQALALFRRRAPAVSVTLEENSADQLLADHRIDLAVLRMWHPIAADGLDQQLVTHEPMCLVTGPQHPLAGRAGVTWADTMAYPWIVPRLGSPARGALEALLASQGLQIPAGEVASISMTFNLALAAIEPCIAMLPQEHALRLAAEGKTVVLPLDTGGLLSEARLFWRRGDPAPALALMIESLVQVGQGAMPPRA
jgi:DNA-binding transcriptional LysR family regulator